MAIQNSFSFANSYSQLKYRVGVQRGQFHILGRKCLFNL